MGCGYGCWLLSCLGSIVDKYNNTCSIIKTKTPKQPITTTSTILNPLSTSPTSSPQIHPYIPIIQLILLYTFKIKLNLHHPFVHHLQVDLDYPFILHIFDELHDYYHLLLLAILSIYSYFLFYFELTTCFLCMFFYCV